MRIDYVCTNYNWASYSVVRTLLSGLRAAGHDVHICKKVPATTKSSVVVVAGSFIPLRKTSVPLVVLGLSDPAHYDKKRSDIADLYLTQSKKLANKLQCPCLPIWADPQYFTPGKGSRAFDCVFLGVANHSLMPERVAIVEKLRAAGIGVLVFGRGWPAHADNHPFVSGPDMVDAYRSAKLLLDLANKATPISSRIFQAMLCGVPVITADRPDAHSLFVVGKELITYNERSVVGVVKKLLSHESTRLSIAKAGRAACLKKHCTSHRVKTLIDAIRTKLLFHG